MTNADALRASLSALRKKQRGARSASNRAYAKAYGIKKGVRSGNPSSRRKGKKTTVEAADGSLAEIGRSPGVVGEGSQTAN